MFSHPCSQVSARLFQKTEKHTPVCTTICLVKEANVLLIRAACSRLRFSTLIFSSDMHVEKGTQSGLIVERLLSCTRRGDEFSCDFSFLVQMASILASTFKKELSSQHAANARAEQERQRLGYESKSSPVLQHAFCIRSLFQGANQCSEREPYYFRYERSTLSQSILPTPLYS